MSFAPNSKANSQLPSRLKLLNWGRNDSTLGPVILNEVTLQNFKAEQKRMGWDRVALDFEHNTVPGTPEYERTHEPRPVAAYGVPLLIRGEGLFLDDLHYTPSGEASAREFCDVSAAPLLDRAGVVLALHSAALTRMGAVPGVRFRTETFSAVTPRFISCVAPISRFVGPRVTGFDRALKAHLIDCIIAKTQ